MLLLHYNIALLLHYNTTLLLRFNTALLLRDCVASSLWHFVASSLRHFVASSLLHCVASSLRHLVASSLRQCVASSLRHFVASSLRHCVTSSPCNSYLSTTAWLTYPSVAVLLCDRHLLWSCPFCFALFSWKFTFFFLLIFFFLLFTFQVCNQSSSSSWFFVSSLIMVVFVESSKTPKNQFITIPSHADKPIEEGITLAVLSSASFIYSSSPIDVNRTPHLSQWWSESSRELYDPSKRDSHLVHSKIFTSRSSLHFGVNYTYSPYLRIV